LAVEDDANWLELLVRQIQSPGLVIHETRRAGKAIELVQKNSYDLLLLDWHMPGVGGHGILQALRGAKVDVPIVVMSGYHDVEHRTQALQLGARAFIEKPRDKRHWAALKRAILETVANEGK
jgi:DNA-binding response OmpR family regulator